MIEEKMHLLICLCVLTQLQTLLTATFANICMSFAAIRGNIHKLTLTLCKQLKQQIIIDNTNDFLARYFFLQTKI